MNRVGQTGQLIKVMIQSCCNAAELAYSTVACKHSSVSVSILNSNCYGSYVHVVAHSIHYIIRIKSSDELGENLEAEIHQQVLGDAPWVSAAGIQTVNPMRIHVYHQPLAEQVTRTV